MSNHVAGPWQLMGATIYAPPDEEGVARIATVDETLATGWSKPVARANARLIVMAPELLEALEWALEQIDDDFDPDHQEALKAARAVVAKAKGG